jgi:hypothetical protein
MIMRYYWGLAVGHVYTRDILPIVNQVDGLLNGQDGGLMDENEEDELQEPSHRLTNNHNPQADGRDASAAAEPGLDDCDSDWIDENWDEGSQTSVEECEEDILAMDEMYGEIEHTLDDYE